MRLVLQLIKGIARVLQKLLKFLNGTIISTLFLLPLVVSPVIFFKLNEALLSLEEKLTIALASVKAGPSLQYYHKHPDVFE